MLTLQHFGAVPIYAHSFFNLFLLYGYCRDILDRRHATKHRRIHLLLFYFAPKPHQVDCITVSLFLFKTSVEDQLQRLADALTLSLRNSVLVNFKAVDAFLEESMEKLGTRPRTIADISTVRNV